MFIHVSKPQVNGKEPAASSAGARQHSANLPVCPAKAILLLYLQLLIRQLIPATTMQPQPPCRPQAPRPAVTSLYLPVKLPRPDVASLARRRVDSRRLETPLLAGGVGGATGGTDFGPTSTAFNWIHLEMIIAAIRGPPRAPPTPPSPSQKEQLTSG